MSCYGRNMSASYFYLIRLTWLCRSSPYSTYCLLLLLILKVGASLRGIERDTEAQCRGQKLLSTQIRFIVLDGRCKGAT